MTTLENNQEPDGSPLAVCINDCEIDYGQEHSKLAPVCFQVGCAFASMRWGTSAERASEMDLVIQQQTYQIPPDKTRR